MDRLLAKSIVIVVAAVLIALCVGSAFAVYSVNATAITVNITATVPVVDECHVLGTFTSWSAANVNLMAYAGGAYSFSDAAVAPGDKFKVYNATDDLWINAVDSITSPYTTDIDGNIVLTKGGQYDIGYTEADGITVTADNYTYTFNITHAGATGGSAVIKAWIWVEGSEGQWTDVTVVNDQQFTATFDTAINRCILARFDPSATVAWNNQWNATATIDISSGSTYSTKFWD